jgi:hypothetical protein
MRTVNVRGLAARGKERMSNTSMSARILALRAMAVPELIAEYRAVVGEEPRSTNKDFLWKRIAWHVQAKEEGGLSERVRARLAELAPEVDARLSRRGARTPAAPAMASAATAGSGKTETIRFARVRRDDLPPPGTLVSRAYRGKLIAVRIAEDGIEFDGVFYRSLSAVANAVTGSHMSGHAFFRLKARKSSAKGKVAK